ncbi:septation ring formation regulator EzrA [Companilactobacillus jidongensis]|uniref:septation ring formation regulator EzrA n=1 Tax=Companilactobacillus jidongensis TaxID=2486006 RepID=UPI000F7B14F4|nr:septation ring formation regulator EzrA [Companilactobacillus jidongensis]
MSIIIIGIIILILVFLWYMWFLQKKNAGILNSYKERADELKEDRLNDKLKKLEEMKLAGASRDQFSKLKSNYQEQLNEIVPSILRQIRSSEYKNTQFKVFGASKQLKQVDQSLNELKEKINSISEELDELSKSDELNATQSEALQQTYEDLRKKILTQSFNYGSAADKLEDELTEIAGLLDKEAQLADKGDHIEASQYLDDVKIKLGLITDQLKVIEPLHHELTEIFPGQIEEINSVYQKLLNQKFKFEEDIESLIKEAQNSLDLSDSELGELNFDHVNNINEEIRQNIDHLYDVLTVEIDAKQNVLKQQKPVLDYINHAKFQHNRLDTRIQKLSNDYVIADDDLKRFKDNFVLLSQIRTNFDQDVQNIADKNAIFSQAESDFKGIVEQLDDIESSEKSINDNFNQMISSERISRNSVDKYAKRLEIQKKIIEQLRLNGLPDDYLDYFYMVYDEITKLYNELDAEQINMEDISKQVIVTQEDLENLVQKTTDLKMNVRLAEKLLQYANRYANKDADFADQLIRARALFDDDYEYGKSVETISAALERVESGSVERIKETINA